MIAWFVWKNTRSDAMGLWVSKLPPIVRPVERSENIIIPGRAGSLTLLEGEDIYDPYLKECRIGCKRNMDIQNVLNWLRGSGTVVFGNEPHKAYKASILSEIRFQRISNDMQEAVVPFFVEPFKRSLHPEEDTVTITTSGSIYNPGDVASRPIVTMSGGSSVTIAGNTMTIGGSGTVKVDCEAEIVTQSGQLFTGSVTGAFFKIPVGSSQVTGSCEIEPNWRWI